MNELLYVTAIVNIRIIMYTSPNKNGMQVLKTEHYIYWTALAKRSWLSQKKCVLILAMQKGTEPLSFMLDKGYS